jgi:predicted Rdx family selenoprotein
VSADWFSTCSACNKPLGPWWLGDDKLCRGHEFVVQVAIDYPDQQTHFTPTNAQRVAHQRWERKRAGAAPKSDPFAGLEKPIRGVRL